MAALPRDQVQELDAYAFLAVLGKRVLEIDCGVGTTAIRMARAIPYLGYVLVSARKLETETA